uniref:Uncharacterized protein n=1 Tax=Arion vulgaris TaxID=1028688 RepID=A0A0B7B1P2_9EUPU
MISLIVQCNNNHFKWFFRAMTSDYFLCCVQASMLWAVSTDLPLCNLDST